MSKSKYGAVPTICDGIRFDSKREAERYGELKLLVIIGEISNLELQPKYTLQGSFKSQGKTYRPITYKADFRYVECATGGVVVEDVKGFKTEVFKIKEKLFRHRYPAIDFRVIN